MVQTTLTSILGFLTKWGQRRAERAKEKHEAALARIQANDRSWADEWAMILLTGPFAMAMAATLLGFLWDAIRGKISVPCPTETEPEQVCLGPGQELAAHMKEAAIQIYNIPASLEDEYLTLLIYGALAAAVGSQSVIERIVKKYKGAK